MNETIEQPQDFNNPDVQNLDTTSQSVNETGEEQPGVDNREAPQANTGVEEAHSNNWNNGARRIARRQSLKARIQELENRLAQYEGKTDDYSRFQQEQLQDRIDDMAALNADAEATEFADHAAKWFGNDTERFMQDTYRYANYVNNNEPDLLKYAQREYGPILLHEWYQRMDNPQLRAQWLQMTAFEKNTVLANFYNQISQIVAQAGRQPRQRQNIPVPNGGRESSSNMPTDDFGVALADAYAKHKR